MLHCTVVFYLTKSTVTVALQYGNPIYSTITTTTYAYIAKLKLYIRLHCTYAIIQSWYCTTLLVLVLYKVLEYCSYVYPTWTIFALGDCHKSCATRWDPYTIEGVRGEPPPSTLRQKHTLTQTHTLQTARTVCLLYSYTLGNCARTYPHVTRIKPRLAAGQS